MADGALVHHHRLIFLGAGLKARGASGDGSGVTSEPSARAHRAKSSERLVQSAPLACGLLRRTSPRRSAKAASHGQRPRAWRFRILRAPPLECATRSANSRSIGLWPTTAASHQKQSRRRESVPRFHRAVRATVIGGIGQRAKSVIVEESMSARDGAIRVGRGSVCQRRRRVTCEKGMPLCALRAQLQRRDDEGSPLPQVL